MASANSYPGRHAPRSDAAGIATRAEANRISYEEVERQLGPEGFAWMFEKGLLLRLRRRSALSRFRILAVVATLISATVT
jgi:dUTPase